MNTEQTSKNIFTQGGEEMIESLTKVFNRVEEEEQILLQWRETSIKTLYKGVDQKKKFRKAREVFS